MPKLGLAQFLSALSIAEATEQTFQAIIDAGYSSFDKILALTPSAMSQIVLAGGGRIGQRAYDIYSSLHSERVSQLIARADAWLDTDASKPVAGSAFPLLIDVTGKRICLTGAGPADRKALAAQLSSAGAIMQSAVSKNTDILICAALDSQKSKANKARVLGTTVLEYSAVFGIV